jgi:hypothetical protein
MYLNCPDDFLAVYSMAIIDGNGNYEYLLNKDVNFIRQAYPGPSSTGTPKYYALFGPATTGTNPVLLTNELSFIIGPTPDSSYGVELHYFFYPPSIIRGQLTTISAVAAGTGYTNGTYSNVLLTNISGVGESATATIIVSGGSVLSTTITSPGCKYLVGDVLSASSASIGGTGVGFSVSVASVENATGTSWIGDNYDPVLLYGTLVEAYTYMKGEADLATAYNIKFGEALAQAKRLGDGMERTDAYRTGQYRQAVT